MTEKQSWVPVLLLPVFWKWCRERRWQLYSFLRSRPNVLTYAAEVVGGDTSPRFAIRWPAFAYDAAGFGAGDRHAEHNNLMVIIDCESEFRPLFYRPLITGLSDPEAYEELYQRYLRGCKEEQKAVDATGDEADVHAHARNMTQKVVDMLNATFQAAPLAVQSLVETRVPVPRELLNSTTSLVVLEPRQQGYVLGPLGLINGVMETLGLPRIAVKYGDLHPLRRDYPFCGFEVYRGEAEKGNGA